MKSSKLWIHKIANDRLLLFFAALMLLLLLLRPTSFPQLNAYIHWPTITALAGLLMITTGIQQSGLMEQWAGQLIGKLHTERSLWLLLISFSAVSAMFLTNDIALFLIIPFTLQLHRQTSLKIRPLLIFETIAVNVGSMLTPIGNPQNIYLWQKMNISFSAFVAGMLPAFLLQAGLLLIALFLISDSSSLHLSHVEQSQKINNKLAWISLLLLIVYLIAYNAGLGIYATVCTALLFLLLFRAVFLRIDWSFLLLFILLFVDMGILSELPFLKTLTISFNPFVPLHSVFMGAGYSQVISNVPATLLLSHYTQHWKYLAWGVNIGANGLLIASFANLIAVRLARPFKIEFIYHRYALPFLFASGLLIYGMMILL